MRRYPVTEGSRAEILAELEQYGADRAQQGKPEKAAVFAQAIHAIEAGAVEVTAGHALYRVVGEQRPRGHVVKEDGREQIRAELLGLQRFYAGHISESDFINAVAAIGYGAAAVFLDGTLYRVVED